ncbi:MAG: hypothetical protein SAK29_18375 [Scytonema sp. PMC 1069.18]|nr:hypothetical protein [Scytonema sp. PMC 1069.18]MEC4880442.1 hypothetical protein [Scytonema sp. PMC 1070.18]
MNFYQRKLYALLQAPELQEWGQNLVSRLECLKNDLPVLKEWWGQSDGRQAQDIGSSSDRVNLHIEKRNNTEKITVRHPISGQKQEVAVLPPPTDAIDISQIQKEEDEEKVFWWFWRFYPELLAHKQPDALLFPAHTVIPDCPLHSHQSTVSALAGAMFPETWRVGDKHQTPYLLVFTECIYLGELSFVNLRPCFVIWITNNHVS